MRKDLKKSSVIVLTVTEAEEKYVNLLATISNVEEFKQAGRSFELEASDTAVHDEICDLEFLLGLDNDE